jgi:hypothetical protein
LNSGDSEAEHWRFFSRQRQELDRTDIPNLSIVRIPGFGSTSIHAPLRPADYGTVWRCCQQSGQDVIANAVLNASNGVKIWPDGHPPFTLEGVDCEPVFQSIRVRGLRVDRR